MYYTVLHRSGWQSDTTWRIARTFQDKQAAIKFSNDKKASDPKDAWYKTKVVSHQKPLNAYTKDGERYQFSGVQAVP